MSSITDSVARLYRAGSEHSQATQKLREATNELLRWIRDNVPKGFRLPYNCEIIAAGHGYPEGVFLKWTSVAGGNHFVRLEIGQDHSRLELFRFSELISEGFLDKLSKSLEAEARRFEETTEQIASFREPKRGR